MLAWQEREQNSSQHGPARYNGQKKGQARCPPRNQQHDGSRGVAGGGDRQPANAVRRCRGCPSRCLEGIEHGLHVQKRRLCGFSKRQRAKGQRGRVRLVAKAEAKWRRMPLPPRLTVGIDVVVAAARSVPARPSHNVTRFVRRGDAWRAEASMRASAERACPGGRWVDR
jgi:hypothetical protein